MRENFLVQAAGGAQRVTRQTGSATAQKRTGHAFHRAGDSQRSRFELIQIDELRSLHARFRPDANQLRRLEESPGIVNRGPRGEMNDAVRVALILENLIGPFAGVLANARRAVEDFLPGRIVGDFMDN